MRNFGTRGPVNPQENYIVSRTEETADFSNRVKEGRYIVLFAPRQSGKTTFFQRAMDALPTRNCRSRCRANLLANTAEF